MKLIEDRRNAISEYWHGKGAPIAEIFGADRDAYAGYYTSMYLIQDTAEAVGTHMRSGFSSNAMAAYIEFWGVMQALVIQQDSISELFKSICGGRLVMPNPSPWFEIRDLRNKCTGHPANKAANGGTLRSFMGRSFGTYERIIYEQYDSGTSTTSHPTFDLKALIQSYDTQAAAVLTAVLTEMKRRCP